MKEWRRTLKSWPKETLRVADSDSLPEWIVEAAQARRDEQIVCRSKRLWTLAFLGPVVPLWFTIVLLPTDQPWTWVLLGSLLGGALLAGLFAGRILERAERRNQDRTVESLEARGEPTLGADFVGAGYDDGAWIYRDVGRHLDEGVFRLDLDRMAFVGRDTRFELPAEAIVATGVRRHEGGFGDRMRLYVHWAHVGEAGTLSLETPYRRSLRRRVREIADLRDRIERWRGEPFPRRTASPLLPLTVSPRKWTNPTTQVGRTAKLLAGAVLVLGQLLLTVGGDLGLHRAGYPELGHRLGGSSSAFVGLGWGLWILLAAKIEARLPERYRVRAKEETDVREALRTVGLAPDASLHEARVETRD